MKVIKGSRVGPRGGGTSPYKTLLNSLLVGGGGGGSTEFIVLMLVFYFVPEQESENGTEHQ